MSNDDDDRSPEDRGGGGSDQNVNNQGDQTQEWETMAGAWLRAFPEARVVSAIEVEGWVDINRDCLPSELKSMERTELIEKLLSIQNILRLPTQQPQEKEDLSQEKEDLCMETEDLCEEKEELCQDKGLHTNPYYQFQRTDQWRPVYSWLESLKTDVVVNTQDIADWLASNSDTRDRLCSKHSRYHLTHYIKKCHMKILKRKEKKKMSEIPFDNPSKDANRSLIPQLPVHIPFNPVNSIPKESELYVAKREEALRKYEILLALEKQLLTLFPKD